MHGDIKIITVTKHCLDK